METSYLKRKKRRTEMAWAISISVALQVGLWLTFHFDIWPYKYMGISLTICFEAMMIYFSCDYFDIKLPKRPQPAWLKTELDALEEMYDEIYSEIFSSERKRVSRDNDHCPKCHSEEDSIVSKISQVKGSMSGDFSLGFGSVSGGTDTKPVNHCNGCGHEWINLEMQYDKVRVDAINKIFSPMHDHFDGKKTSGKDKLKNFKAKAVKIFIKKRKYGYAEDLKGLSERDLRKYGCA